MVDVLGVVCIIRLSRSKVTRKELKKINWLSFVLELSAVVFQIFKKNLKIA